VRQTDSERLELALTLRGVEREYGIPRPTARRAIADGKLRASRPGPARTVFVLREDLHAWLRACAMSPDRADSRADAEARP
jgi:excisionase family DNA binding protein